MIRIEHGTVESDPKRFAGTYVRCRADDGFPFQVDIVRRDWSRIKRGDRLGCVMFLGLSLWYWKEKTHGPS